MQSDNSYTIEMEKAEEELLICYWCFSTLEEAQVFLNRLKNACTTLSVTLSMYDAKHQLLEAWAVGNEFAPSQCITSERASKTF